jgi:acylphosphatase
MKHYTAYISGKVQGVFYRVSTKEKAEELGLKGIVENLPDGRVYLEAEGEENKLEQLMEWCRKGPKNAMVEDVFVEEGEIRNYKDFSVRRG